VDQQLIIGEDIGKELNSVVRNYGLFAMDHDGKLQILTPRLKNGYKPGTREEVSHGIF